MYKSINIQSNFKGKGEFLSVPKSIIKVFKNEMRFKTKE